MVLLTFLYSFSHRFFENPMNARDFLPRKKRTHTHTQAHGHVHTANTHVHIHIHTSTCVLPTHTEIFLGNRVFTSTSQNSSTNKEEPLN